MTRAVLYARVSGNDQAKTGGENLQDQLRLCREYARERGYTVAAELAEDDTGASGATFDLPKLSEALEMARAGAFDRLVVRELDRLSRDLAKQLIVEQELKRVGVSIEYVLYDFPDTPEGRLNKNLRAMLAEYEKEKINQRMTRGRERKARAGELVFYGRIPYGYLRVRGEGQTPLEIDEQAAAVVRRIFRWYTEGDQDGGLMGARSIALRLSDAGVPTWSDLHTNLRRTSDHRWRRQGISLIVKNEIYAGVWRYGAHKIPVEVPAIVSREVWERAQRQRSENTIKAKRNTKHSYLMQHRLSCPTCQRRLTCRTVNRPKGHSKYYSCHAQYDRTGIPCANHHHYRADAVDAVVWSWLRDQLTAPEKLEGSLRGYQAQRADRLAPIREELAAARDLIGSTETKRERLLYQYLDGLFDRDLLTERKQQYDDQLVKLQQRAGLLKGQVEQDSFSEEQLQSVLTFARKIGAGIAEADKDFSRRRELVEVLDIEGVLLFEDGQEIIELRGALGEESVSIAGVGSGTSCDRPWSCHRPL